MKTLIRPFAAMVMLLFVVSSFAQTAHPVTHPPVKHYRHHKKVYPVAHRLPLPPAPPAPKLPPLPPHP